MAKDLLRLLNININVLCILAINVYIIHDAVVDNHVGDRRRDMFEVRSSSVLHHCCHSWGRCLAKIDTRGNCNSPLLVTTEPIRTQEKSPQVHVLAANRDLIEHFLDISTCNFFSTPEFQYHTCKIVDWVFSFPHYTIQRSAILVWLRGVKADSAGGGSRIFVCDI